MNDEILVAHIINENKVVLNIGSYEDVSEGDIFMVYALSDDDIKDPRTGKSLGRLELVKGRGKVINVQEHMCTIESIETKIRKKTRSSVAFPFSSVDESISESIPFDHVYVGDYAKKI